MSPQPDQTLVFRARHLCRDFKRTNGSATTVVHAVNDVSLDVAAGQRLGIVGESGSGKSTLVRMLAALMRPTKGSLQFCGQEITGLQERDLGELRKGVQVVFQDPRSSLDPRMKVSRIITEPLRSRCCGVVRPAGAGRTAGRGDAAGGAGPIGRRPYPHEFSGGQRQRIAIARAWRRAPGVDRRRGRLGTGRLGSGTGPEPHRCPGAPGRPDAAVRQPHLRWCVTSVTRSP